MITLRIFIAILVANSLSCYGMESESALFDAVIASDLARVQTLLQEGTEPNIQDEKGNTPLAYAAYQEVSTADQKFANDKIITALLKASADPNIINKNKQSPLMAAVDRNKINIVKLLVDSGADVDAQDNNGSTSLVYATYQGFLDSAHQEKAINAEITKILLMTGTNPNLVNKDTDSPLIWAVTRGKADATKLLLEHKADVNFKGSRQRTPLSEAINARPRNLVEIVTLLLQHGADVNMQSRGTTPLHQVLELSSYSPASKQEIIELVQLLLAAGADPNLQNEERRTALHIAVDKQIWDQALESYSIPLITTLIKAGADPSITGSFPGWWFDQTPLTLYKYQIYQKGQAATTDKRIVDLLTVKPGGTTPLHHVVHGGHLATAALEVAIKPLPGGPPTGPHGTGAPTGGATPGAKSLTTGPGLLQRKHLIRAAIASTIGAALYGIYYFSTLEELPTNLKWDELQAKLVTALANQQYDYAYQLAKANPPAVQALAADPSAQQELKKLIEQVELDLINETVPKTASLNPLRYFGHASTSAQLQSLANLMQVIEQPIIA